MDSDEPRPSLGGGHGMDAPSPYPGDGRAISGRALSAFRLGRPFRVVPATDGYGSRLLQLSEGRGGGSGGDELSRVRAEPPSAAVTKYSDRQSICSLSAIFIADFAGPARQV